MSMKNPLTPSGIEPATFRFVAQHLNLLARELFFFLILAHPGFSAIHTPLQRNLPTHKSGLNIHTLTHLCPHRQGNSRAQSHSSHSHIIAQPRMNTKQRTQDFTPGSIPPQQLQFFLYITFILCRCLFNY